MKKLPKIYQNEFQKKINNNKMVFDSLKDNLKDFETLKEEETLEEKKEFDNLSVREKIKSLMSGNSYIFNTKVKLVFEDREEINQIAGVVNNHIVTMDNKIIKIDELKDIKIFKK